MLRFSQILVTGLLCLYTQVAFASHSGGEDEYALQFQSATLGAELIELNFALPLAGMVELHLYDASGERVWYNIYSLKKGQHTIRLKRAGFQSDGYTYRLKFKESEHTGTIPLD